MKVSVSALTFDAAGAHVAFKITDKNGTALDRAGLLTDGPVAVSFVLAQLAANPDGSPGQYTAYTTRTVSKQYPTPDSTVTATQATTESVAANFTTVDVTQGTYTYSFAAPLTGLDPTLTQTVLAVAVRTQTSGQSIDRTTFSARPDLGTTIARQVVTSQACDACHGSLGLHGGRYTAPEQCVLCHQPQTSDPDTGNTVDFKVMVHKIHQGTDLTQKPYQIIGYMGSVEDWSTVEFPQDIGNCRSCHAPAAAQGDRWETAPTRETCTSCHDNIVFDYPIPTGYVLHSGGTQPANSQCNVCHPATGSIAGIFDKHYTGLLSPTATQVGLSLSCASCGIANAGPGQVPTVTFQATVNGAPVTNLTATTGLSRVNVVIAGPTTDESFAISARAVGSSATIGTLTPVDAANGIYQYALPSTGCTNQVADGVFPTTTSCALPTPLAGSTVSYRVGLEGYLQASTTAPRYAAPNVTLTFALTGATTVPRRQIVAAAKCNGCHYSLSAHGGSRNDPDYCVMCHNTSLENVRTTLTQGSSFLGFTLDFRSMIHKIHRGENLTQAYVIGTSVFNDGQGNGERYPRTTADCGACHVSANYALPLSASDAYLPSQQQLFTCPDSPATLGTTCSVQPTATATIAQAPFTLKPLQPTTSVCTSCHDADFTLAHAQTNTTSDGVEACAACHGPGTVYDIAKFHTTP